MASTADRLAGVRGVLLDVDGVIVTSWEPLQGAVEAVARLRGMVPVRLVTNTTSRSAAEIVSLLTAVGVEVGVDEMVTAGAATAALLRRHHPTARCLVLNDGSDADLAGLDLVGPEDPGAASADVVVVGSAGPLFTWDALNTAVRALVAGAELVGMHGSSTWTTAEGLCVDGGAYLGLLESASGVRATVVGKPAPQMFLSGAASMGLDPSEVLMVGDDLHSDVLAAMDVGMTGVLVRTGKFRPDVLRGLDRGPDLVLGSIADLPALLPSATT